MYKIYQKSGNNVEKFVKIYKKKLLKITENWVKIWQIWVKSAKKGSY